MTIILVKISVRINKFSFPEPKQMTETINNADQTGDTEEEVRNPLIFQCKKCKTVVGDTFSWICSDAELNSITLSSTSAQVNIQDEIIFCSEGFDIGRYYTFF
jgi:hypothetical protein